MEKILLTLRLLLTACAHIALSCAFVVSENRWTSSMLWTWVVATIAYTLVVWARSGFERTDGHGAYALAASAVFAATGLPYHGAYYWLPAAVFETLNPVLVWPESFDGVTGASPGGYAYFQFALERRRDMAACISIPIIGMVMAALTSARSRRLT